VTTKITIGVGMDTGVAAQEVTLTGYTPIYTYRKDGRKHLCIQVDEDGGIEVSTMNGLVAVYPRSANVVDIKETPR
jgi:hypothetical protein